MKWSQLITDDKDRISSSKICYLVGFALLGFCLVWSVIHGYDFAAACASFAPFICGVKVIEKFLLWKYGGQNANLPNP